MNLNMLMNLTRDECITLFLAALLVIGVLWLLKKMFTGESSSERAWKRADELEKRILKGDPLTPKELEFLRAHYEYIGSLK